MFSRRVALTSTFAMLTVGGLMACDTPQDEDPNEDGVFYCADENGVVVDPEYCDNSSGDVDSGFFFFYMGSSIHGSSPHKVGSRVPAGAQKFRANDIAARQKFGLPPRGTISNGTIKPNVVGKGGPGSSLPKAGTVGKGGSSGGGKGASGGG
jgi:hypothetical protein